jgi:hypothetical protein
MRVHTTSVRKTNGKRLGLPTTQPLRLPPEEDVSFSRACRHLETSCMFMYRPVGLVLITQYTLSRTCCVYQLLVPSRSLKFVCCISATIPVCAGRARACMRLTSAFDRRSMARLLLHHHGHHFKAVPRLHACKSVLDFMHAVFTRVRARAGVPHTQLLLCIRPLHTQTCAQRMPTATATCVSLYQHFIASAHVDADVFSHARIYRLHK